MSDYSLVIFDCDGVLIDSEIISAETLVSELARCGVSIDLDYVARFLLGRSFSNVPKRIADDFGIELPDRFESDYRERLLEAFSEHLRIMPGIEDVLKRIGTPIWLATSSSPERLSGSLRITGLDRYFVGNVTTTAEVEHGKPSPDLFLHAAEKAGADPERCLVIEDSPAGLEAGLAAGMEVWHFTGGSHCRYVDFSTSPQVRPHRQFASFADFFHLAPTLHQFGS